MKRNIETTILINASLEAVWSVLIDFDQYPSWSPTVRFFEGNPKVGNRSKVLLRQPNGMQIKMNPMFLNIDKDRELRWQGRLWMNGIFDGEHYFLLESLPNGQTLLIQGESFSGILIPLLKKMIDGETKNGFILFNQALKDRVEQRVSGI